MATIAEILLQRGRDEAATRLRQGEISAGLWNNLGQIASNVFTQIPQARAIEQRQQLGQLQLDAAQHEAAGRKAFAAIQQPVIPQGPVEPGQPPLQATNPYFKDEGNIQVLDTEAITRAMAAQGFGDLGPQTAKDITALNDAYRTDAAHQAQAAQTRNDLWAQVGGTVRAALREHPDADPKALLELLGQQAIANRKATPEQVQSVIAGLLSNPAQLPGRLDAMMALGSKAPIAVPESSRLVSPYDPGGKPIVPADPRDFAEAEFGIPQADGSVKNVKGVFDKKNAQYMYQGQVVPNAIKFQPPPELRPEQRLSPDPSGKFVPTDVVFHATGPFAGNYTLPGGKEIVQTKPIPTAASVNLALNQLSPAALDMNARRFLDSGTLPQGYGLGVQRTQIMNRAAEIDPQAALARMTAVYKADQVNLTNLQRTEGALSAFEKTANKNIDTFLAIADKIPDTGVPWINTPVRALNLSLLGSQEQAAVNAARGIANREVARVTTDPKLSGALTDAARREVTELNRPDYTLAQMKRVARLMKTDMQNVHQGLNEQIQEIINNIGTNPAGGRTGGTGPANDPARIR